MINTVTGKINMSDIKNVFIHEHIMCASNDMCIYSDFSHRKQNGLHLTYEEQSYTFGFTFRKILPDFLALGGTDEAVKKMVRDNALDILNV